MADGKRGLSGLIGQLCVKETLAAPLSDLWMDGMHLEEGFWPKARVKASSDNRFLETEQIQRGIDSTLNAPPTTKCGVPRAH